MSLSSRGVKPLVLQYEFPIILIIYIVYSTLIIDVRGDHGTLERTFRRSNESRNVQPEPSRVDAILFIFQRIVIFWCVYAMCPDCCPRRTIMSQPRRKEKSTGTNLKTVSSGYHWNQNKGDMDFALMSEALYIRALSDGPVYFKGDVIVIDPFKIFFTDEHFANRREELRERCKEVGKQLRNYVITYKGIESVFVTSPCWEEQYAAFEVVRKGTTIGVQETLSNIIAAIPSKLVDLCIEEGSCDLSSNFDKRAALQGGVICEDVDGEFLSSNDGDFVFSRQTSCPESAKLSEWIQDEHPNKYADVLCATGGCWTYPDDSSSDSSEDSLILDATEEDDLVMKAIESEQEMDSYIRAVGKVSIQDPACQLQISPKLSR